MKRFISKFFTYRVNVAATKPRVNVRFGAMPAIAASGSALGLFGWYFVATHSREDFESWGDLGSPLFDRLGSPRAVYKDQQTDNLVRALSVLQLCQLSRIADPIVSVLNFLGLEGVLQSTFGQHFCAGKTVDDAVKESVTMLKESGVYPILDMARESTFSDKDRDDTETLILNSISKSPKSSAIAIKISGLFDNNMLRELSAKLKDTWTAPASLPVNLLDVASDHSQEAQKQMLLLQERLDRMCKAAAEKNVILLVDAEQSWFQPGIDAIAIELAKRHNTSKCVVYNTYQMYLQASPQRLKRDLLCAESEGWRLGAKIVRGAYMSSETENGNRSLINTSIEDTHDAYNKAVQEVLKKAFVNKKNAPGLVIATHNVRSMELAAEAIERQGKPTDAIVFAQLKGMQEAATRALLARGMKVYKYMPYGDTKEVMPYLLRRAQENSSMLGSAELDRKLLLNEIKARIYETLSPRVYF